MTLEDHVKALEEALALNDGDDGGVWLQAEALREHVPALLTALADRDAELARLTAERDYELDESRRRWRD